MQYERRAKNNAFIRARGIACYEDLPVIESSADVKLRSLDEISRRALASFFLIQVACDVNNGCYEESVRIIRPILERLDLISCLNAKERRLLDGTFAMQDAIDLDWEYEDLWSLFYALGFVDDIRDAGDVCDCGYIIETVNACSSLEDFRSKCKLRGVEEILDTLDLYYRYHWACVEHRLHPETPIADLIPSCVVERRRGLEWLISDEDDWFEITLDT